MEISSPRGVVIAGGATSQLMGLAALKYLQQQGVAVELFYLATGMSHTAGFVFEGLIDFQEIQSVGRVEKYFPKQLQSLLNPLRWIFASSARTLSRLTSSKRIHSIETLETRIDGKLFEVATWNTETGLINGGIWAGTIGIVAKDLRDFFQDSSLPNPFEQRIIRQRNIAIHYRLGDMRTDPHWRRTHGVLDPTIIYNEVTKIRTLSDNTLPIFVYSDEPRMAKLLLESVGLFECIYLEPLNIWADIREMSNSDYFVGSFSTVSMVVAEIRNFHGLPSSNLPLNCRKHKVTQKQINSTYFEAKTLPIRHWTYNTSSKNDK